MLDKEYKKLYENIDNYDANFKKLAETVSDIISKALDKDEKILLLSSDQDNLVAAIMIYFLMKQYNFSYTNSMSMLRDRRISIKLDKQ